MLFFSFLKVSYMIWWRFFAISIIFMAFRRYALIDFLFSGTGLFFIPLIAAAIIVFVKKKTIPFFPIFKKLFGDGEIFEDIDGYEDTKKKKKKPKAADGSNVIKKATNRGRLTGYEPYVVKNIEYPKIQRMNGLPGSGLSDSGFNKKSVTTGQMGEENLAKILYMTNGFSNVIPKEDLGKGNSILENVYTFWSLYLPHENSTASNIFRADHDADVDMIMLYKDTLLLVDAKFYSGGDVTYTESNTGDAMNIVDNATGKTIGASKKMTNNMKMAKERYQKAFPHLKVKGMVVLVPTNSGIGEIKGSIYWPGLIPLRDINSAIRSINTMWSHYTDNNNPNQRDIDSLTKLMKYED